MHRAHNQEMLCASLGVALWLYPKLATVKKERPDMYQHLVLQVGDQLCDKYLKGRKPTHLEIHFKGSVTRRSLRKWHLCPPFLT